MEGDVKLEIVRNELLSEWVVDNFREFGATLEFITDKSTEGSQFVRGFGGIGGMLRYQMDMMGLNALDEAEFEEDFSDFL